MASVEKWFSDDFFVLRSESFLHELRKKDILSLYLYT